jgi:hypothetical protein
MTNYDEVTTNNCLELREAAQFASELRRLLSSATLQTLRQSKLRLERKCGELPEALESEGPASEAAQLNISIKKRFDEAQKALNESGYALLDQTAELVVVRRAAVN